MTTNDNMFSNFIMILIFLIFMVVGGLLAGMIYYDMNILQTELLKVNFDIPIEGNNATAVALNTTDFQDLLSIVVYPILGLKDALPYITYFMVFAFIIALGISAYLSSKNPLFFVLHILFTLLITYFCLIISNTYVDLMTNPFLNAMMLPFTIYNKLMFYLPQVVFFTSIIFGAISFINLIKPKASNLSTGLQYGGDY